MLWLIKEKKAYGAKRHHNNDVKLSFELKYKTNVKNIKKCSPKCLLPVYLPSIHVYVTGYIRSAFKQMNARLCAVHLNVVLIDIWAYAFYQFVCSSRKSVSRDYF